MQTKSSTEGHPVVSTLPQSNAAPKSVFNKYTCEKVAAVAIAIISTAIIVVAAMNIIPIEYAAIGIFGILVDVVLAIHLIKSRRSQMLDNKELPKEINDGSKEQQETTSAQDAKPKKPKFTHADVTQLYIEGTARLHNKSANVLSVLNDIDKVKEEAVKVKTEESTQIQPPVLIDGYPVQLFLVKQLVQYCTQTEVSKQEKEGLKLILETVQPLFSVHFDIIKFYKTLVLHVEPTIIQSLIIKLIPRFERICDLFKLEPVTKKSQNGKEEETKTPLLKKLGENAPSINRFAYTTIGLRDQGIGEAERILRVGYVILLISDEVMKKKSEIITEATYEKNPDLDSHHATLNEKMVGVEEVISLYQRYANLINNMKEILEAIDKEKNS